MRFGRIRNNLPRKHLLFIVFLFILTLWSVWPVVKNSGGVLVGQGDVILITWIINQNIQKLPYRLPQLFDGNIFYPFKDVMAYSELFLPSSLISYLPVKITGLPAAGFNFSLIIGQLSTLLIAYFWFKEITGKRFASLIGVAALGLSQIRMFFHPYLQMWNMQWFLLACFAVWKYKKSENPRFLIAASIFSAVQTWESLLPVYFIIFSSFIILLPGIKRFIKDAKWIVISALIYFVLSFPLLYKYYSVSREFQIVRSIREAAHFSMNLNDIWGILFSPGLFILFLTAIYLLKKKYFKNNDLYWLYGVGITGFLMALGPVLKLYDSTFKMYGKFFIPLPYSVFYYIIPGFDSLRTPLRWIWLSAFAMSGVIAVSLAMYKGKKRNILYLICLITAISGGTRIKNVIKVPIPSEYPKVYNFIKTIPGRVIVEMPIYSWGAGKPFQNEFWRMFYSLDHGKYLLNGASGLNPPEWLILQSYLWEHFPKEESTSKLKETGVDYVVVHKNEYDLDKLKLITAWGKDKLLWEDEGTLVYSLMQK